VQIFTHVVAIKWLLHWTCDLSADR